MKGSLALKADLHSPAQRHAASALWQRRLDLEQHWGLHGGAEDRFRNAHAKWSTLTIRTILQVLGLYEKGLANARRPILRHLDLRFPELPAALNGFRILHLSDFHFSRTDTAFVDAVAALLAGVEADVCCITGDFRFGHFGPVDHVETMLQRALAGVTSPLGHYAILGNHDVSTMLPHLARAGVEVLVNGGVALEHGGSTVWIGGVDDPHRFKCAGFEAAFEGAAEAQFRIALVHTPECIASAWRHGADLYLCGHTHGGQICLPWLGAIHTNARCPKQYRKGVWNWEGMQGHTTPGLGATDVRVRFNCPPEAALITLQGS
ncbi:MAG: metallophosphoesterase [Candidatus Hydrogenedentes bacterium]|nr:metallophosphoesterase [Candidatus Hydrogenedentota bacterium]